MVVIDGSKSTPAPVTSGVPQGTLLGPLQFLAYINGFPESVKSKIRLFADDSLLYRYFQHNSDFIQLQQDLDSLQVWESKRQIAFNADKCEVLRITNKRRPICADYYIHSQRLASNTDAKYLGETISNYLSRSKHTDNVTKKANSMIAFLRRNIRSASQAAKETAYQTFVKPTLEYASTTWAPYTETDIRKLEMAQRREPRFVFSDY